MTAAVVSLSVLLVFAVWRAYGLYEELPSERARAEDAQQKLRKIEQLTKQ